MESGNDAPSRMAAEVKGYDRDRSEGARGEGEGDEEIEAGRGKSWGGLQ
jgi:hypothetical protein